MANPNNPLRKLNAAGQSVWCDNIHRAMLTSGGLLTMIEDDDLRGVTSNPAIFDKAIGTSHAYDALLERELERDRSQSPRDLFFALAIEDIRDAADAMRPVYEKTGGVDGMVSLEVSPDLAHDTEATLREARELHARLGRPNVMIKVPGTRAGLPAIEQLTAEGINVNVTLLFSVERYAEVAEAYLRGLERRLAQGQPIDRIASVASFFISRVDTLLDPMLAETRPDLQGRIAIANAKLAYQRYKRIYGGERFEALRAAGARPQRLLWASTGAKNPAYPELLYVEELIGPETVSTMPPATYEGFREAGTVAQTLEQDVAEAERQVKALAEVGIDLAAAADRLEQEGVALFVKAFTNLLHHLEAKAARLAA
ncbi:transaldolase [Benzoatithermus flavus]|uniref:Transaldolase n=1 Tax=Benzoatithermus flavus TaxID=3108223 RepID=A0ABU8Y0A3_9PROT